MENIGTLNYIAKAPCCCCWCRDKKYGKNSNGFN